MTPTQRRVQLLGVVVFSGRSMYPMVTDPTPEAYQRSHDWAATPAPTSGPVRCPGFTQWEKERTPPMAGSVVVINGG
jgi:hypothetical protein